MNREELEKYIAEAFGVEAEHPWEDKPEYSVFRHSSNRKWFAVTMRIPSRLLGLEGQGEIDIVNLKCDYVLICSLLSKKGFFPAYHMNKVHWISVALGMGVESDEIKWLVEISRDLTSPKRKKKKE